MTEAECPHANSYPTRVLSIAPDQEGRTVIYWIGECEDCEGQLMSRHIRRTEWRSLPFQVVADELKAQTTV